MNPVVPRDKNVIIREPNYTIIKYILRYISACVKFAERISNAYNACLISIADKEHRGTSKSAVRFVSRRGETL